MPFGNVVEYHILYILAKIDRPVMYRRENIAQIMFLTCFSMGEHLFLQYLKNY